MSFLCIQNIGEVSPLAFQLVGASTKEGMGKIGFFGSGNKYAISTLLRKGVPFVVMSGTNEIKFEVKDVEFGGQTFGQIFLDDQPTSFTTRMGPQWETWMALREFVCNAMDEGGDSVSEQDEPAGITGFTQIFVDMAHEEVAAFFRDISQVINTELPEVTKNDGPLLVYRKGIRCVETPKPEGQQSIFCYNFDSLSINESRLYDSHPELQQKCMDVIRGFTDEELISDFFAKVKSPKYIEHGFSWYWTAWSEEIIEYLKHARFIINLDLRNTVPPEDEMGSLVVPSSIYNSLKSVEGLNLYHEKLKESDYDVVDTPEPILKAIDRLKSWNLATIDRVLAVQYRQETIMGSWERGVGVKIRDSADYEEALSTLIEEFAHAKGFGDGSRGLTNYLVDELIKANKKIDTMAATVVRNLI